MRSTFDELEKELNELRALVASIAPVNSVLVGHTDALVKQYVTIRRRFDYAAFAVAIYSSFEKFIENTVAAYVKLVARRLPYGSLPKKLERNHLLNSADLLSRGELGSGRYAGISELEVVKNLFECLNGVTPYTLNEDAVVAHRANLRSGEIDKLFAMVEIENICSGIRRADALLKWYCTSNELGAAPPDGVSAATIEERLKDIVDRRNRVAHRGGNPDDLLGSDEMSDAIDFIEAFSKSVFAMAVGRYLRDHHSTSGHSIQLQQRKADGPYERGTVVVVEKPAQRLFVGQPVFVIVDSNGARWGRIQSMQVDNTDVKAVDPVDTVLSGIGIALDFKCPEGAALIALAADDDVVWSRAAG